MALDIDAYLAGHASWRHLLWTSAHSGHRVRGGAVDPRDPRGVDRGCGRFPFLSPIPGGRARARGEHSGAKLYALASFLLGAPHCVERKISSTSNFYLDFRGAYGFCYYRVGRALLYRSVRSSPVLLGRAVARDPECRRHRDGTSKSRGLRKSSELLILSGAGVAELADAQDLGSCGLKTVEVQVLSPAPEFF